MLRFGILISIAAVWNACFETEPRRKEASSMNMNGTEEQNMMRQMVRSFAQNEVAPEVERMETEDRLPEELLQKMGELGLMGIPISDAYGGSGMDFTSYIIAIHELSRV